MAHIFVTGASSGIGLAIVEELISHDYTLHLTARNDSDVKRLESLSPRITVYKMDVSNHSDILRCAKLLKKNLGNEKLSVLINNAGIAEAGPIELVDLDGVRQEFAVNVFAVIDLIQQTIPLMNENNCKIINISSKSGRIALPFTGAYAASKFALEALSDALRRELSNTGIRVVVVQPGAVKTPIWEKANQIDLDKYIGSRYEKIMETVKNRVIEGGRNGADPHKLATLINHIIQLNKPKNRYVFAKHPFMEIYLMRILPERWLDSKIRSALYGKKNS